MTETAELIERLKTGDDLHTRIEAAATIQSLSDRIAVLGELADLCAKVEADAVSGLRYIERVHGRLSGVGWDRVFDAHNELFTKAASLTPQEPK